MRAPNRFLALCLAMAAAPAAAALEPASVMRDIDKRGAKQALARLAKQGADWGGLLDGVSSGGREWLRVANRLLAVAEDPEAYDLEAAVGEALAASPARVLEIADAGGEIQVSWVCDETTSFEKDPGLEERIALLADREDAVRSLRAPALAAKRATCLKSLEKARTGLERELSALTRKIG